MNKRMILAGLAVAGVVAASGSAFTDSNTLPADNSGAVGYGATAVTGITVSSVEYDPLATDTTKLQTVTFNTLDDDLLTSNGYLTITDATETVIATRDCEAPTGDNTVSYVYTCTIASGDEPAMSAVETVGFSVTRNS
jgi:hypothetical protein